MQLTKWELIGFRGRREAYNWFISEGNKRVSKFSLLNVSKSRETLFCTRSFWIQIIFNRSIWPFDGTLTGTTTSGQSSPGNNANKGVLSTP